MVDLSGMGTDEFLFQFFERRYTVNGARLRAVRERHGLSQEGFAWRCGWSLSHQRRLENGDVLSISESDAEIIARLMRSLIAQG